MIFWNKICGFILFLLLSCLFCGAQSISFKKLNYNTFLLKNDLKAVGATIHRISLISLNTPSISLFNKAKNLQSAVNADFSTSSYGFFCREELKIEKFTKMPIRFRLGSMEQCNYYEAKKQ
jgi:hypothetical protein